MREFFFSTRRGLRWYRLLLVRIAVTRWLRQHGTCFLGFHNFRRPQNQTPHCEKCGCVPHDYKRVPVAAEVLRDLRARHNPTICDVDCPMRALLGYVSSLEKQLALGRAIKTIYETSVD